MSRGRTTTIALLVTIGLAALFAAFWTFRKNGGSQAAPSAGAQNAEKKFVKLTPEAMREFGIATASANSGHLLKTLSLPGEIAVNGDHTVHVVPRVSGVVREVRKVLGERARKGEILVLLESKELADLKAAFLAARERTALNETVMTREEDLWKRRISSEQEYLQAKQAYTEAAIELRSTEQKLHALGFTEETIKALPLHPDASFTPYEIAAPLDGVVIEKHVTVGEAIREDTDVFTIADLDSVWVDISVYPKDLPYIKTGQSVVLSDDYGGPETPAAIAYIGPLIGEKTRTALARIILPNPTGAWRPGTFIHASVAVQDIPVPLLVPKSALQTIDGRPHLFLLLPEGFAARPVRTGREDEKSVEILEGLQLGETYASEGTFTLKSELLKSQMEGE
jgi:cobalt-zinc-cadmium efflux system membrane fusion protein